MLDTLAAVLLIVPAVYVALPLLSDVLAGLVGAFSARPPVPVSTAVEERLLFLVPAHNESELIQRCVSSLIRQSYPSSHVRIAVIADNCTDNTAELARAAGATVLERRDARGGKGFAIEWALQQIPSESYDAVVVIDADTIVEPDFSTQLIRAAPLANVALQAYDGLSNEYDNSLTRLAGLLTRSRYEVALPLKVRAGLSCPLTGDGIVLGREVLRKFPWRADTITEGWELYARLTLGGLHVGYAPGAKLYAQEARSMRQSSTQRERWSAGRMAILREYWSAILRSAHLGTLQKLDLIAELSSQGPVVRTIVALVVLVAALVSSPPGGTAIIALALGAIVHLSVFAALALVRHPQRGRTILALGYLPVYAIWRLLIALRVLTRSPTRWIRTARHGEG